MPERNSEGDIGCGSVAPHAPSILEVASEFLTALGQDVEATVKPAMRH
jgi:hypothetical protein